jgi:hypothetical protein
MAEITATGLSGWTDRRRQRRRPGGAAPRKLLALRVAVMAALLVVTALAGTEPQPASAATPEPLHGHTVRGAGSAFNSSSSKRVDVSCPAGKQVLGGGAEISVDPSDPSIRRHITLTQMEPYRNGAGGYAFAVTAVEVEPGTDGAWSIYAQAICADPVAGYNIVIRSTPLSSEARQAISPACPAGQNILGTGARVNQVPVLPGDQFPHVGLQVLRADGLGGLTRAQAHEWATGYPDDWQLLGFAVCGQAPRGYQIVGGRSDEEDSETQKFAGVNCPGTKRLINPGAGITNIAPGNVTLNTLRGFLNGGNVFRLANVYAFENTLTTVDWDWVAVQAICVDIG